MIKAKTQADVFSATSECLNWSVYKTDDYFTLNLRRDDISVTHHLSVSSAQEIIELLQEAIK